MIFEAGAYRCVELTQADIPRLQRFYEANPEYFVTVNGEPPKPDAARDEFASLPPEGWRFEKKWMLAFEDRAGAMVAMAGGVSGLFVPQVWHLGLFVLETRSHGLGVADALLDGLESWMRETGARWSRLGVADCNPRAGRFWRRRGYVELRRHDGLKMGRNTNTVRIMAKPLDGASWDEYMRLVERDRPDQ